MKEQTTRTPPKLRVLSAFLAVAMLLTLLPAAAFAADPPGWYYTKDGVKYFNDINSTVWQVYKYEGSAAEISLPETINDGKGRNYYVGAIRQKAFQDNTRITGVTFPERYYYVINAWAFSGCTNLTTVNTTTALMDVGERAFENCTSLRSFAMPGEHRQSVDSYAFSGCTSLQSFSMVGYPGKAEIADHVFSGCKNLTQVSLSANVVSIGDNAFENCTNLESITLYNTIKEFGENVFQNSGLKTVYFEGTPEEWNANTVIKGKLPAGVTVVCTKPSEPGGGETGGGETGGGGTGGGETGGGETGGGGTDPEPDQPIEGTYKLWIKGIQVTDENKDDVLNDKDDEENLEGEATVVFDPDTMTLNLRYAHLDCWGTGETPIRSGLPQLTITGIGGAVLGRTNSITAENGDILFDDGDISLVRGTISANNLTFRNGSWIRMTEWDDTAAGIVANGTIDIDGSKVVIENEEKPCAIWAKGGDLTVSNGSTVQLQVQSTALKGSGKLCVMDGQWYRTSKDSQYEKGTGTPAAFPDSAYFEVVNKNLNLDWYHVWVAGTQANSENKGNIAPDIVRGGTISYDSENDILRISGPVTLGSPTEPINKSLLAGDSYSKTTKLTADQTVEGWVTGAWHDGISSMDEIVAGHYILHAVDPDGNEGIVGQRNTKIHSGVTVELHNFKKGISFDPVTIYGDVFIYDGEIGLTGFDCTLMPGATLEIHAKKFLSTTETSRMHYKGGHLTMNAADSTTEDRGLAALNAEVDKFWYRTGPEAAFVETTAEAFNSNKPLDAVYLELTDEEPSMDGYFIEGDYTYKITADGNVRIVAYGGSEADVVVPATLGGRNVTEIGNSTRGVFDTNAAIRSVTFPDTLKEMSGLPLFNGCENLETITIPAGVTRMYFHSAADCFISNCPNLKTIIFKGTRAQWEAIEKESVDLDGITVRCSDGTIDPVNPNPDPDPKPDPGDEDVFLQFEDCSVDVEKPDGTTLHFDATGVKQSQRLPKGAKVTITLDEKAIPEGMKFSCWVFDDPRPEDLMEDGTTATFTMQGDIGVLAKFSTLEEEDSSADFGTIAAATAVVGVVGATAYLVGTEVALNQLLPAGTSVPQDRAQLALLLWNTAGRPEPAALPAFADVTDPDTAKAAQWCMEAGFFQPREDGNFKPGKHVSRWKVLRTYQQTVK